MPGGIMTTLRVVLVVSLSLLLAMFFGNSNKPRRGQIVTGSVTTAPEVRRTVVEVDRLVKRKQLTRDVLIPTHFRKRGERTWTELDDHQREVYTILAVFFRNALIMVTVAACEAELRHVNEDGTVVIGGGTPDMGAFQINPVHFANMRKLGLDPANFVHNVAYAAYLANRRPSLGDWNSSKHCWGNPQGVEFRFPNT